MPMFVRWCDEALQSTSALCEVISGGLEHSNVTCCVCRLGAACRRRSLTPETAARSILWRSQRLRPSSRGDRFERDLQRARPSTADRYSARGVIGQRVCLGLDVELHWDDSGSTASKSPLEAVSLKPYICWIGRTLLEHHHDMALSTHRQRLGMMWTVVALICLSELHARAGNPS
jgi:hypothetical protein